MDDDNIIIIFFKNITTSNSSEENQWMSWVVGLSTLGGMVYAAQIGWNLVGIPTNNTGFGILGAIIGGIIGAVLGAIVGWLAAVIIPIILGIAICGGLFYFVYYLFTQPIN